MARQVTLLDPTACGQLALALAGAAAWVGCTRITVERVEPASAAADLTRALGHQN